VAGLQIRSVFAILLDCCARHPPKATGIRCHLATYMRLIGRWSRARTCHCATSCERLGSKRFRKNLGQHVATWQPYGTYSSPEPYQRRPCVALYYKPLRLSLHSYFFPAVDVFGVHCQVHPERQGGHPKRLGRIHTVCTTCLWALLLVLLILSLWLVRMM